MASNTEPKDENSDILTMKLLNGTKNKSKDDGSKQGTTLSIVPVVNDPQHLQLCAVHTINNLLQLTQNSKIEGDGKVSIGGEESSLKSESTRSVLIQGELYRQSKLEFASKKELELIANEMSNRETAWMNGNEESDKGEKKGGRSLLKILRSNHRSTFTGNFSFEVLEAALTKREIALNWFNVTSDTKPSHLTKYNNAKDKDSLQVVVGYVINSKEEMNPYCFKSLAKAALPFCLGRHWFAITKVRVVTDVSHHDSGSQRTANGASKSYINSNSGVVIEYNEEKWYIVDSESHKVKELKNDVELLEMLKDVKKNDGNVFQAVTQSLYKLSA